MDILCNISNAATITQSNHNENRKKENNPQHNKQN